MNKYLGCTDIKRDRRTNSDLDFIKTKLVLKLAGWKAWILSASGKFVLIKSTLTGMSQYSMDWFKFSKSVCKDIDKISRESF